MNIDAIIDQTRNLPAAPQVAIKLLDVLKKEEQDNEKIVEIIQYDAVLTAKLLKACNSAAVSRGSEVGSVDQAILRMGHQEVFRMVMALCAGEVLSRPLEAYGVDSQSLWHHSITTAIAAQKLREFCPKDLGEPSIAFTAGLLHDIGKIVLNQSALPEIQKIRDLVESNQKSRHEAEREILGVDHTEIGKRLVERWKLPPIIVEAVGNHHHPPIEDKPSLSGIIHVANCCAHCIGSSFGWNSLATRLDERIIFRLDLKQEYLEHTLISVHEAADKIKAFMEAL